MEKKSYLWFWMLLALFIFLLYCISTDRLYCTTPVEEGSGQLVRLAASDHTVAGKDQVVGQEPCAPAIRESGHRRLPESVGSTGLPTYKGAVGVDRESDRLVLHTAPDHWTSLGDCGFTQG